MKKYRIAQETWPKTSNDLDKTITSHYTYVRNYGQKCITIQVLVFTKVWAAPTRQFTDHPPLHCSVMKWVTPVLYHHFTKGFFQSDRSGPNCPGSINYWSARLSSWIISCRTLFWPDWVPTNGPWGRTFLGSFSRLWHKGLIETRLSCATGWSSCLVLPREEAFCRSMADFSIYFTVLQARVCECSTCWHG